MKANTYDIKFTRITRFLLGDQSPRLFTQLGFYISLPVVFWYLMFFSFTLVASVFFIYPGGNAYGRCATQRKSGS